MPDRDPWLRTQQYYGYSTVLTADRLADAREIICGAIEEIARPAPDAWFAIDDLVRFIRPQAPDLLFNFRLGCL